MLGFTSTKQETFISIYVSANQGVPPQTIYHQPFWDKELAPEWMSIKALPHSSESLMGGNRWGVLKSWLVT